MNQDRSNLLDSVRSDPSTNPPFYWHHIRPECQRWGVLELWRTSSPATRPFFNLGETNGEYGPNWVAGWLLYSVFRSRDVRNNRNRRRGDDSGGFSSFHTPSGLRVIVDIGLMSTDKRKVSGEPQKTKGYYDPVRE